MSWWTDWRPMMRRRAGARGLGAVLLALALLALAGCAAPDFGMTTSTHGRHAWALRMDNADLDDILSVTDYKAARRQGVTRATVTIVSRHSKTLVLEARFVWMADDGTFLEGEGFVPWRTVTLKPGVPKTLKAKSFDLAAANVRLQVRGGARAPII